MPGTPPSELTLAEELLFLGLDPARSRPRIQFRYFRYGLAAALLADLEAYGSVTEERGRLVVLRPVPIGRPPLDQVLNELSAASAGLPKGKGERVTKWLRTNAKGAEQLAADGLAARGLIRIEEQRALGLFPHRQYHVADQQAHGRVLAAFHDALKGPFPDRRSRALTGLVLATDLAARLGAPWRVRRELRPLVREQWFAEAVRKQIYSDKSAANGAG
ncbi:GPP34 family phosphoprotein [Streptomyces sp. Ru73]|uniref:GOLPH3/VPS74 family protein n=1 Tax=Streptomyces sp. Ru73 TaxID=2080748 RepID=UPI0015E31E90|nr:GPP34 family phosphoprotein [Streptomyces sp. Ru73]